MKVAPGLTLGNSRPPGMTQHLSDGSKKVARLAAYCNASGNPSEEEYIGGLLA